MSVIAYGCPLYKLTLKIYYLIALTYIYFLYFQESFIAKVKDYVHRYAKR